MMNLSKMTRVVGLAAIAAAVSALLVADSARATATPGNFSVARRERPERPEKPGFTRAERPEKPQKPEKPGFAGDSAI